MGVWAGLFFVTVFGLIVGAALAIERWKAPVAEEAEAGPVIVPETLSSISVWDDILERLDGVSHARRHLREAGLGWSVGRLTLMMLLGAAATGVVSFGSSGVPWVAAGVLTVVAGAAPYGVVLRRRRRRLAEAQDQFPAALDTLARALRSGAPLGAALELVSRETPAPLGVELVRLVDEHALGLGWPQALAGLAGRLPLAEVHVFSAAVQLHSRAGGRLHDALSKLAEGMREASALRGELRAIAAHGRLTGAILTILPIVIAAGSFYLNPAMMLRLWNDPVGSALIWVAGGCLVLAHVIIGRMVEAKV